MLLYESEVRESSLRGSSTGQKTCIVQKVLPLMFLGRSKQILGKVPSPLRVMLSDSRWATCIWNVLWKTSGTPGR